MKPKLLSIIVANLFIASSFAVHAAEMDWSGSSVSAGYLYDSDKANDPSKLNEYRDLDSGGLFGFEVKGRGSADYLNAYGENIGRDDMYLDLKGGRYGLFKYRLYDNELRHRYGFGPGAISPYAGIGTAILTNPGTLGIPNTGGWSHFDHSYERRDWGGMFEWQTNSPWYFRVDANEVTREGVNVFAGALGTSPGQGMSDLPSPIDYTTRDASLEAGYSAKRGHFAVSLGYSKFENDNPLLNWTQLGANPPAVPAGVDTTVLPQDNKMWRLAMNGNLRQLPGNSTLAGRFTYSKLTSDVPIPAANLWGSTGVSGTFDGEIEKYTFSTSYTSNPMRNLDTKLYYNYVDDKNKSSHVDFIASTGGLANCAPLCEPEQFEYTKNNFGAEAGYRINRANKLRGLIDYTHIDRQRIDFEKTKDTTLGVEWKNTSLDNLTARIKYQYLHRKADWVYPPAAVVTANPYEPFTRRFDLNDKDQNLFKLVLDATPAPMVDLGFEAIYKKNDYDADNLFGRQSDERQEFYASVSFGDPKKFRVIVFGDIEYQKYESFHRVGTGSADPATPPTAANYNWWANNKDKSWQVGIGADFVPMNRLKVSTSLILAETQGTADFAVQPGGSPTAGQQPIGNFDNARRASFVIKGVYTVDRHWELTGGYSYEQYRYDDIGYNDTMYIIPNANTARYSYFTGQFSFQDYSANLFYLIAKYKF